MALNPFLACDRPSYCCVTTEACEANTLPLSHISSSVSLVYSHRHLSPSVDLQRMMSVKSNVTYHIFSSVNEGV